MPQTCMNTSWICSYAHTHTCAHVGAFTCQCICELLSKRAFFSPVCCQPSADCIATEALEVCCCSCSAYIIAIVIVVASMHNVYMCSGCHRQSLRFTFRLSAHSRVLSMSDSRISAAWCNLRKNNLESRKWKSQRNYFHRQIILKILHCSYFL